jgi:FKBP-type peptidyl-prolyl cis-trans isomerase
MLQRCFLKKISALFVTLTILSFQVLAQKANPKSNEVPKPIIKLASPADSLQYIFGAFVAQWMNNNGFRITNESIFLQGMHDMFENRQRQVPDSLIGPNIIAVRRAGQREKGRKQEIQLFESIKNMPGMGVLPGGINYLVLKTGKGPYPTDKDTLIINMIAKLADGTIVEDTYQKKSPFIVTFPALFKGLADPLALMAEGSQWQLYIPSALAYGEKETPSVPPYSSLIITVELLEIRHPKS